MTQKPKRLFVITVLSLAVFFGAALLSAIILGWVLGSTTGPDGTEEIKGGGLVSIIILGFSSAVTIAFAWWFNEFLTKKSKGTG